jgi:hypothetical protein
MDSNSGITAPGTVVVRYANQSGALVTVSHRPPQQRLVAYGAECSACLDDTDSHFAVNETLKAARDWASKHAAECRALPQPGGAALINRDADAAMDRAIRKYGRD